jgi:hypothetical protein
MFAVLVVSDWTAGLVS